MDREIDKVFMSEGEVVQAFGSAGDLGGVQIRMEPQGGEVTKAGENGLARDGPTSISLHLLLSHL